MGGSFGSKQAKDALRQALYLSEKLYKPVQLMWTREHEMQNSYPMQMSQHRVQIGLDEKKYAGHSLRSGFATTTAEYGADERNIMAMTGHKSVDMVRRYIKEADLF